MDASDKKLFDILKQAVADTYLKENQAPSSIEEWKGEDIVGFQEDLFERTRGRVSEKWFYTYFKNDPAKIPRIDMLNLLSKYAGYEQWNSFKSSNIPLVKTALKKKSNKKYLWLFLPMAPLLLALYFLMDFNNEYRFCMVEEDRGEPITMPMDIKILSDSQSPIYLKTDSTGCFSFESKENIIRFVVQSPYHKTDTVIRNFDSNSNAMVPMATDDYALMLRYYSSGNVKELKKRRAQLTELIADNARIYQVFPKQSGIELYSKEEFINKLTIPTSSLKNINILDKRYEDGKIVKLKFSIQ